MKNLGDYLVGDVRGSVGGDRGEDFLDELAELMVKYDVDAVQVGWKKPESFPEVVVQ